MCECVWLMILIVVVCVCRLGEEYVCGCECIWVPREVGYRDTFCCDNLNCGFKKKSSMSVSYY